MFEHISGFVVDLISQMPYFWIFVFMFLESSFVPFPSEIVMIPAGWFAAQGKISLIIAIISGILGSLAGALFNYYLAKLGGIKLSKKLIGEKYHNIGIKFFKKYGDITTFIGRLVPLFRQYISFPAGLFEMNLKKFIIYTTLGASIWVFFLALLGYYAGKNEQLIHQYKYYFLFFIVILTILLIGIKLFIIKKLKDK